MTSFLREATKTAFTQNGAVSYSTTGFDKLGACLDYFSKAGTYTGRSQHEVDADMSKIFADDQDTALSIVLGLRLITRKPQGLGLDTQTGYGRRDEFYKACVWLINNKPDLFYANLHLIPVFGCWKDLLNDPLIQVIDFNKSYELAKANLDSDLLRKYLPQIRSSGQIRSDRDRHRVQWAKGFCKFLGISFAEYRKLKSQGAAHIWQRQVSSGQWDSINFNGIPGKAMFKATTTVGKDGQSIFERHGQIERLKKWVLSQPAVKFTGYPYELTRVAAELGGKPNLVKKMILDKQFESVIAPMKNHKLGNVLACLDTSGSMTQEVMPGVSAMDICLSMGIAFSFFNTGYFKDVVCAFADRPIISKLRGGMTDRMNFLQTDREFRDVAWGSTNFQGVINFLCDMRMRKPEIAVSEYPETLLVISDMQFNDCGRNSNSEEARRKLEQVGLGHIRLIWWFVNGQNSDFPCSMDAKSQYIISGFDPVNIKALMGIESKDSVKKSTGDRIENSEPEKETPLDGMLNFIGQPIFKLIQT